MDPPPPEEAEAEAAATAAAEAEEAAVTGSIQIVLPGGPLAGAGATAHIAVAGSKFVGLRSPGPASVCC